MEDEWEIVQMFMYMYMYFDMATFIPNLLNISYDDEIFAQLLQLFVCKEINCTLIYMYITAITVNVVD